VSKRTDWQTPPALFLPLHLQVVFKVDAAADQSNHLLPVWYGPGGTAEDALGVADWLSPAFCNPPYGSDIERWLDKFIEQVNRGHEVVALLPARVDTRWWFEKVVQHADIMFLVGRVPFIGPDRLKPSQPDHGSTLCCYSPFANRRVGWKEWRVK
jgi:phage N-6-adenine-methyltransferase